VIQRPILRSVPTSLASKRRRTGTAAAIAGVLAALLIAIALVTLLGMRQDLASLERAATIQQGLVERQLGVIRDQLSLLRESLGIQRSTLGDVGRTTSLTTGIDRRIEQLQRLLEQIRDDVGEMNRRTGGGR
jgi:hypothetical protein